MQETALFVGEDSCQDGLRLDSSARNALSLGATLVVRCVAGNGPKGQFWGSRHSDSGWRRPALAVFFGTRPPGPKRRDGGRRAQDATVTPVITIGYAIVLAPINPEAHSDATAPVKSKSTPA
jgi:hypothetical protein